MQGNTQKVQCNIEKKAIQKKILYMRENYFELKFSGLQEN